MTNERLRSAMSAAHISIDDAATAVAVDPKTIQRWLNGRVPHRRHRWRLAELLKEDEKFLWPTSDGSREQSPECMAEIVAAYARRALMPIPTWRQLVASATGQIDILGYAVLFLLEQQPDIVQVFTEKGNDGCRIRVALGDPDCLHVRERDAEEEMNGGLRARIRTSLRYLRDVLDSPVIHIRLYNAPLYNSIFRFDNEMIVTPHLFGTPGPNAPILQLRRLAPGGIFDSFVGHFESVWAAGASATLHIPQTGPPARVPSRSA